MCNLCKTFQGNPCECCRTASRLTWLLQYCRLHPSQEEAALLALRNCVGAVTDLVETAGRIPGPNSGAGVPEAGAGSPEAAKREPKTEEERGKAKTEESKHSPRSSKEEKKSRKKDKKDPKKRSRSRSGRGSAKDKKSDCNTKTEKEEELEEVKEEPLESEKESQKEERRVREAVDKTIAYGEGKNLSKKELAEKAVEAYVREKPEDFGLHFGPDESTRTSGKHGRNPTAQERKRQERTWGPRPPSYSPPRRHGERLRHPSPEPIRRRHKKKKNKGYSHYLRGVNWRKRKGFDGR